MAYRRPLPFQSAQPLPETIRNHSASMDLHSSSDMLVICHREDRGGAANQTTSKETYNGTSTNADDRPAAQIPRDLP